MNYSPPHIWLNIGAFPHTQPFLIYDFATDPNWISWYIRKISFSFFLCCSIFSGMEPKSTHRVAIADFWRISHHDGKISPGWWGWGLHAHPLSTCVLPSRTQLQCTLLCWEGVNEECVQYMKSLHHVYVLIIVHITFAQFAQFLSLFWKKARSGCFIYMYECMEKTWRGAAFGRLETGGLTDRDTHRAQSVAQNFIF